MSRLAGSAAKKAQDRLRAKLDEAEAPIVMDPTPRWRGLGFEGILAAALTANAPKPGEKRSSVTGSVISSGNEPVSAQKAEEDAEKAAAKEALQAVRQKKGMLQKKIFTAEQRVATTAKETEKLQKTFDKLEGEVRDVVGKRFKVEVKANDLENHLQELQEKQDSLLQQAHLDQVALNRTSWVQGCILMDIVGARPRTAGDDPNRTLSANKKGGSKDSHRHAPKVRPSSGSSHGRQTHKIPKMDYETALKRPASSPTLNKRGAVASTVSEKWLPPEYAEALLKEGACITQDLQSAMAWSRMSCPLLQETARLETELHHREEGLHGLEQKRTVEEHALENLKHSVDDMHTEIKKMQVARQIKMVNVRNWRDKITSLQEECAQQEQAVAVSQSEVEEQQINAAAQAAQMQPPLENNKQLQEKLKGEISHNDGLCRRRELEARHLNDWRLANAAQFKRQRELEEGRARRVQAANVHLQKQIWQAQDSSLSFSTQNRTMNVRV